MLGKANKKSNVDEATVVKVNQELIVHNMPNVPTHSFTKAPAAASASGSQFLSASGKKNNHQTVGIVIVGLGIVFIGALVYLSYRFIIKPAAQPAAPVVSAPVSSVATTAPSTVVNDIQSPVAASTASTTAVAEISPSVVDLISSSTASTSSSTVSTATSSDVSTPITEEIPPLLDTDSDGLTDDEEIALGTDSSLPDTDGDSYGDLSEIINGYNPTGSNKLVDSSYLKKYQNQTGKYEIYYPGAWTLKSLNNDYATIISAPDNSLIQISVQDNPNIQSISSWYGITFPDESVNSGRLKAGSGWEGIMGADALNFYLTDSGRENIYIISYIPALSERLAYPNIFDLIIKSFKVN